MSAGFNCVHRALRSACSNYLFAGSHEVPVNIAMYRSFFATCRANDIDAHQWLLYVLRTIRSTTTDKYHSLLPQYIDRELLG